MIAFALEELASGSEARRRGLVRHLCLRWPEAPALSVVFAMTSAAATLEDNIRRNADATNAAPLAYRLAAILAADIYAVESMGQKPATAEDLLHFWRRVDSYFLDI
ncbi:MAG: hypothetical protein KDK53_00115 [Maritimibacter sp.]|nr:hypothetical protein [Maritimibacter sp.]